MGYNSVPKAVICVDASWDQYFDQLLDAKIKPYLGETKLDVNFESFMSKIRMFQEVNKDLFRSSWSKLG